MLMKKRNPVRGAIRLRRGKCTAPRCRLNAMPTGQFCEDHAKVGTKLGFRVSQSRVQRRFRRGATYWATAPRRPTIRMKYVGRFVMDGDPIFVFKKLKGGQA